MLAEIERIEDLLDLGSLKSQVKLLLLLVTLVTKLWGRVSSRYGASRRGTARLAEVAARERRLRGAAHTAD